MSTDNEKSNLLKGNPKEITSDEDNYEDANFDDADLDAPNEQDDGDSFEDCETVEKGGDADTDTEETEQRLREGAMTDEEKANNHTEAECLKVEANTLFKNGNYEQSLDVYTKALSLCPTMNTHTRSVLYSNRSAAKMKMGCTGAAITDCNRALKLDPVYVKVLLRRGKLLEETDKLDEALADYKQVVELDDTCREAQDAVTRLNAKIAERNEELKEKMVGQLKNLGNMILKPFGLSTNNFQMVQDPNTGSYSINLKQ